MARSSSLRGGAAAVAVAVLSLALLPNAPAAPPATWSISGTLLSHSGIPVPGANVTLVTSPCPVLPDPNGYELCPYVASGVTNASGAFTIGIPEVPGSFWVFSHPADGFGGDYAYLGTVRGPVSGVALTVWPYRPYGNTTIVLPGYSLLAAFACNGQAPKGCGTSFQVPILSWTSDGVTYVNDSGDLVFYSFVNRTTYLESSSWTPLHQNFMAYGGVENTEWVTADGSYVYTLGCPFVCGSQSYLEFEAVNVSTGARVTHVWNVTAHATSANGQGDMIGLNGSSGYADLIDQNGTIHLWSLANQTEWVAGKLAFFEANNVYWVPVLNSYIDVSAGGSTRDEVDQYRFNGTGFDLVYDGSWGNGTTSDFVNGLVYNLSAHQIYFEAGSYSRSVLVTDTLSVGPNGTITASSPRPSFGNPYWPQRKWTQVTPNSPEHRIATTAWGPTIASDFSPLFYNSSWLQDPTTGTWFDTNQSMDNGGPTADNAPETVDAQFYNGTYSIDPASVYCAGTGNKNWSPDFCPLEGTFPNTTKGTVWWFWQIGQPMFPFSADAPSAQPSAPAAPTVQVASIGATTVTLNWTLPNDTGAPLLNWTVFWGLSPGNYTNSTSLVPWAHSYAVPGLEAGTRYYFEVEALNHHWFGPPGRASGVPLGRPRPPLAAPTLLTIHNLGPRPTLSWQNPAGPEVNTSVYWGRSCSDLSPGVSLGGVATVFTLPSVPNGTTEWFAVAAWSASGRSGLSNCVSDAPPAPTIVYPISMNATTVGLYLTERISPVFNHSLRYGPASCSAFPGRESTGNGRPWSYVSGLNRSQSYCFEAASWSYGGESPWSPPVSAPTYGPTPDAPSDLEVVPSTLGNVTLRWVNPPGPVVNDTVEWGPSCALLGTRVSTQGPATAAVVGGTANGTASWFMVVAWSPAGESVPSECVSDVPAVPSIVSAGLSGPTALSLTVSDQGGAVYGHSLRYGIGSCASGWTIRVYAPPSPRLTLSGLNTATTYCLEVATMSQGGLSGWSSPVTATTFPEAPPPAIQLRVAAVGLDSVTLEWVDPPAMITNITILGGSTCDGALAISNRSPTATVATLDGLSASTTYCLSVQLWNGSEPSTRTPSVTATTLATAGPTPAVPASVPRTPVSAFLVAGALGSLAIAAMLPLALGRRRRPPPNGKPRGPRSSASATSRRGRSSRAPTLRAPRDREPTRRAAPRYG